MAKSTATRTAPSTTSGAQVSDTKLEAFADDLGRLLGEARNKADGWLSQRDAIVKHLEGVRETATRLRAQLARPRGAAPSRRAPGRPRTASAEARPARRKRRTMSAEARAKIAAAQRARWAKQKAGKK
jgi:hypothetical protein